LATKIVEVNLYQKETILQTPYSHAPNDMTDQDDLTDEQSDELLPNTKKYMVFNRRKLIFSLTLPLLLSTAAAIFCYEMIVRHHQSLGYCSLLMAVLLSGLGGGYKSSLTATVVTFSFLNITLLSSRTIPEVADLREQGIYLLVALFQCMVIYRSQMVIKVVRLRELKERRAMYRREKRRNDMIQMAIHELKSPVTLVSSYIQLTMKSLDSTHHPQEYQFMEHAYKQINKINLFVSDMMDLAQIKSGEIQFKFENFDLRSCISEVVELFRQTYGDHQFGLNTMEHPAMIYGDCARITQVITNFISNAIKYSPDSKAIDIRILELDNEIEIEVTDYGVGIAAEHHDGIFHKFYRAHSDNRQHYSGWGLGLYIASEIISKHDGKIGVKNSAPGNGSTFWISLPKIY
jgi:signal transduction histidine kinase